MEISKNTIFKRKWRWTFQGVDKNNNPVFPEHFVKMSHRPAFPYKAVGDVNGGHLEFEPGEVSITQYHTMYEEKGEARRKFEEIYGREKEVVAGRVKLYDGCGDLLEQWDFLEVKMTLNPLSEIDDDDHIVAEWSVKYKKSVHNFIKGINEWKM